MKVFALTGFNNYYNRLVKKSDDLQYYINNSTNVEMYTNVNFNANDGVNATLVLGGLSPYSGKADYFLVVDNYGSQIISRWYIIESSFTRNGQYNVTLYRDTIADAFDIIATAPMFVEKGSIPSGSPLIYNHENLTVNQIKQSQEDLYDGSGNAWLVMYLAKDVFVDVDNEGHKTEIDSRTFEFKAPILNAPSLDTIDELQDGNLPYSKAEVKFAFENRTDGTPDRYGVITFNADGTYSSEHVVFSGETKLTRPIVDIISNTVKQWNFNSYVPTPRNVDDASVWNGSVVKDTNNNYFTVKVKQEKKTREVNLQWNTDVGLRIKEEVQFVYPNWDYRTNNTFNKIKVEYYEQTVEYEPISSTDSAYTLTVVNTMQRCIDAPYYILYTPYNENRLNIITALVESMGSYCYDAQILPYSPEERTRRPENQRVTYNTDLYVKVGTTNQFPIYLSTQASFKFDIAYNKEMPTSALEIKVANESEFVRLQSPNGSGTFEFIPVKNNGIHGFHVECTYKPVTPYINICPKFSGLYGSDFKDFRGLICQGDFSIPVLSSAFVQYEQQNKNYLNIFNRQIENMNVNNKYQRINEIASAIAGTAQGAATGAIIGSTYAGAGVGGAIAGGTASLLGGITDLIINEKLRNEAIDYTKDQFGYNLGNIQARPDTLVKVGSVGIDNHYVPYIEFYSCTEEEKEAIRQKIIYNGMTVGVVGRLSEYITTIKTDTPVYVKGKIIRLVGIEEDYHLIATIGKELNEGVYV